MTRTGKLIGAGPGAALAATGTNLLYREKGAANRARQLTLALQGKAGKEKRPEEAEDRPAPAPAPHKKAVPKSARKRA
ncbi:MAG TPA: hypothetical protein DCZ92_01355 [Elusimicrobia bacterium]|nr:MAG: hypothetical protein A2016_00520 [Elusimicrobia bacterium GWF2_62_30]HBA59474.1 hypothetical protein [Elusimicrobiota bacterium]